MIYDGLVRFSTDGASVEMKYAESVTPSDDFTSWTIKLRKGSKWSDGEPFTADDIMFWYKDVLQNKDLMPAVPSWMLNKDGSLVKVEKVDDLSVKFTFEDPNTCSCWSSPRRTAATRTIPIFLPSNYLKQFHADLRQARTTWTRWWPTPSSRPGRELFYSTQRPIRQPRAPGHGGLDRRRTASATRSSS